MIPVLPDQLAEFRRNQDAQSRLLMAISDSAQTISAGVAEVQATLDQPAGTALIDTLKALTETVGHLAELITALPQAIAAEIRQGRTRER